MSWEEEGGGDRREGENAYNQSLHLQLAQG